MPHDEAKGEFVPPTENYWSGLWQSEPLPRPVDPEDKSLRNHVRQAHLQLFERFLDSRSQGGVHLLELGCAQSAWLPYFAERLNWTVSGLDYSEPGCRQARQMLANQNSQGTIYQADFFAPPPELWGKFDRVVSFGLIEHFADTAAALRASARFLNSNGLMLKVVPNMNGLPGFLQKRLGRKIYDLHVPLSREDLNVAAKTAKLEVVESGYLMFSHFGVLNLGPDPLNRLLSMGLIALSVLTWVLEKIGLRFPENRWTSPFVYLVARPQR
jgi:SAM-dependent methyltransferase